MAKIRNKTLLITINSIILTAKLTGQSKFHYVTLGHLKTLAVVVFPVFHLIIKTKTDCAINRKPGAEGIVVMRSNTCVFVGYGTGVAQSVHQKNSAITTYNKCMGSLQPHGYTLELLLGRLCQLSI